MRNSMVEIVLALVLGATRLPQSIPFEQFLVSERFTGKLADPDLASHPQASMYRAILRREAQKGPDFASHFTVVRIGCGTGCAKITVVDAASGTVFFPGRSSFTYTAGWWHEPSGRYYRLDSRLLVVYGQAGSEDAPYGISYFEWTGRDFKLLRFEPHDPGRP